MNESQAVADLQWAINSPSLLDSFTSSLMTGCCLDLFSVDGRRLMGFLEQNPTRRVGRHFEQLVGFYLQHVLKCEVVACQQPIVADGRTIGEIDFLYRDPTGLLTHLEVAVKFYLHLPDTSHGGSHFVGPNAADTFERKTQRLFDHQLPLSETYFPEVDRRAVLMKGRIYYHPSEPAPEPVPGGMSACHLRGTWIRACELERLPSRSRVKWCILQKPHWLTVGTDDTLLGIETFKAHVQKHFAESESPLHCAALVGGREQERIFIVAEDWPA